MDFLTLDFGNLGNFRLKGSVWENMEKKNKRRDKRWERDIKKLS